MTDIEVFDDAYNMGVRHVIEYVSNRIYYIPENWKRGEARTILNIVENALKDCETFYTDREG